MGPLRFLFFYLAAGAAAGLGAHLLPARFDDPDGGRQRAVAGVLGAYLVLYPKARVLTLRPPSDAMAEIPAVFFLGVWFVFQLFSGALQLSISRAAAAWRSSPTSAASWRGSSSGGAARLTRRRSPAAD